MANAIGLIPFSSLSFVSMMVLSESNHWLGKNIEWRTGEKYSKTAWTAWIAWTAWTGALRLQQYN